jgi:hypothetical protein
VSGYGRRGRTDHASGNVWPVLLAGVLAAAVIVTTVAVVVLSRNSSGETAAPDSDGSAVAVPNSPMTVLGERPVVPDSCGVIRVSLTRALVPDADKTNMRSPDTTDQHTECAWAEYGTSRTRTLTVELRALKAAGGATATTVARQSFQSEYQADSAGKGLLATQRVVTRQVLVDLGDEAYVTYSSDKVQTLGEAIVNVRIVNVLVTVHYGGGDIRGTKGTPLSQTAAIKGATAAARQAAATLAAQQ